MYNNLLYLILQMSIPFIPRRNSNENFQNFKVPRNKIHYYFRKGIVNNKCRVYDDNRHTSNGFMINISIYTYVLSILLLNITCNLLSRCTRWEFLIQCIETPSNRSDTYKDN